MLRSSLIPHLLARASRSARAACLALLLLVTGSLAGCATSATTTSARHVHVLIFASAYEHSALHLDNTLVDGKAVEKVFKNGISTDVLLFSDPTPEVWQRQLEEFRNRLSSTDIAIIYYAGHGLQKDGLNYFVSGNGTSASLISADEVLSFVMGGNPRATIFFIDACRNNPFRSASFGNVAQLQSSDVAIHSVSRAYSQTPGGDPTPAKISGAQLGMTGDGLRQMAAVHGGNAIVFFSTDPGNVAIDGPAGLGSPFAGAVETELQKQVTLDEALRSIEQSVSSVTHAQQVPWRQGDLSFPLYLAGQPGIDPPLPPTY